MKTVLLHGLGQSPESWKGVRAELGVGLEVLCPALSGLLRGGPASYPSLYRGLEDYCKGQAGPLGLCGLSLGGILALQYALEHPKRVERLALIGTQVCMPAGLLRVQDLIFHLLPAGSFRSMGFPKADVICLTRSMRTLDFQDKLSRICCPVLVVCGDRDRANRKAAFQMEEAIPGAELILLEGAGHEANIDQPKVLGRTLKRFLTSEA